MSIKKNNFNIQKVDSEELQEITNDDNYIQNNIISNKNLKLKIKDHIKPINYNSPNLKYVNEKSKNKKTGNTNISDLDKFSKQSSEKNNKAAKNKKILNNSKIKIQEYFNDEVESRNKKSMLNSNKKNSKAENLLSSISPKNKKNDNHEENFSY